VVERIKEIPTMAAQFTYELLDHFQRAYQERFHLTLPPVHDPCAVAVCLEPSLFTFESAEVKVETAGKHTYGETVIDASAADGPVQVAVEVDNDKFWDLIVQSLKNLP
jgi:purine nucleosidase